MIAFSWDYNRLSVYLVVVFKRSKAVLKFLLSNCGIQKEERTLHGTTSHL